MTSAPKAIATDRYVSQKWIWLWLLRIMYQAITGTAATARAAASQAACDQRRRCRWRQATTATVIAAAPSTSGVSGRSSQYEKFFVKPLSRDPRTSTYSPLVRNEI